MFSARRPLLLFSVGLAGLAPACGSEPERDERSTTPGTTAVATTGTTQSSPEPAPAATEPSSRPQSSSPPASSHPVKKPEVSARREGDHIRVRYRVPPTPEQHVVLITVHSSEPSFPGRSNDPPLENPPPEGEVLIPLPAGKAPYVARISVITNKGRTTPVVERPVRNSR